MIRNEEDDLDKVISALALIAKNMELFSDQVTARILDLDERLKAIEARKGKVNKPYDTV